ncbi:hypothetical protein [Paracoccus tegillarcae]|uniref:Uncharacterized protein n=1 Tax=Paracoccus tegillarcae TaxID=1529068 RepID=A0A2K9ECU8_9RHOB|nr:hypothetical protein [Paracoccus tegillarcae]AUH32753.1 hypothetical protein CUV01_04585 [Paracoccus tegillarcae]
MSDTPPSAGEGLPVQPDLSLPSQPRINLPSSPPLPELPEDPPATSLADCAPCCGFSASTRFSSIADDVYFSNPIDYWAMENRGHISVAEPAAPNAVVVKKTVSLTYQMGANATDHSARILTELSDAFSEWERVASSARVRVKMIGCPDKDLRILLQHEIVPSGGDIIIRVDNTPVPPDPNDELRSYVDGGTDMTHYLNGGDSWVMVHEIGHTIGLGDEYLYESPSTTEPVITVYGHDMNDFVLTIPYAGQHPVDPAAPAGKAPLHFFENPTVMGQYGNMTFRTYMYYWVAYETSQALASDGRLNGVYIV